jgi:uncharacterized membrane protein YoaK (UPF0700 family)
VNGFGFLACQQFVTHVTGTATRMGLEWPHVGIAGEYAAVLLSFVAGALASTLALQARGFRGKRPLWASPLLVVAAILLGVAVAGHFGAFGPLGGAAAADEPPAALLSLLAFAMGLQNAAVETMTGLAVRTTHLTGPATDLGIHLGTAYFATGEQRRAALKGAALRGGKALAFVAGAGLALPLSSALGYFALLAPAALVLIAAAFSFVPAWSPSDFPTPEDDTASDAPLDRAHREPPNGEAVRPPRRGAAGAEALRRVSGGAAPVGRSRAGGAPEWRAVNAGGVGMWRGD